MNRRMPAATVLLISAISTARPITPPAEKEDLKTWLGKVTHSEAARTAVVEFVECCREYSTSCASLDKAIRREEGGETIAKLWGERLNAAEKVLDKAKAVLEQSKNKGFKSIDEDVVAALDLKTRVMLSVDRLAEGDNQTTNSDTIDKMHRGINRALRGDSSDFKLTRLVYDFAIDDPIKNVIKSMSEFEGNAKKESASDQKSPTTKPR